jgi:membrane fusion protein (multidrug efflux system)
MVMRRTAQLAISSVVVAGMGLALAGCSSSNSQADQATVLAASQPAKAAAPVSTPTPQREPAAGSDEFIASGPVVVENEIEVAALRDGVVVRIMATPGQHVRKGQMLALLDSRQLTNDLEAARAKERSMAANLENWKAQTRVSQADLARTEKLWAAELITREQLEHTQYQEKANEYEVQRESELLNNARATTRSLELEKEKTSIVAPFDGLVARRYVRVGQRVSAGERLLWITALGPLEVRFTIPERLLNKVRRQQAVSVTSADLVPAAEHRAHIVEISPVVDPSSGTVDVMAQLEGPAADLRPGMLTRIRLDLK